MKLSRLTELNPDLFADDLQLRAHLDFLKAINNTQQFIDNVDTDLRYLAIGNSLIPVTINETAYDSCYVCSVYTAFISYARVELKKINSKLIQNFLSLLITILDKLFKRVGIDRIISHNNFLLSTNLYPSLSLEQTALSTYLTQLIQQYPQHVYIFRSLNIHTNAELMQQLLAAGFDLYPSRQVYIFDKNLLDFNQKNNFMCDLKKLTQQKYYIHVTNDDITELDYPRIVELYNQLYIEKYSIFNPQFNSNYIALSHQTKLINYFGLRNSQGILDAIVGCYDYGDTTTTPIVGYDTRLPQQLGLYRMLMAYCIDRAARLGLILNLSSGASHFKLLRGGTPFIEYSAVYTKHLRGLPAIVWRLLRYLLNYIVVPLMKKYKL